MVSLMNGKNGRLVRIVAEEVFKIEKGYVLILNMAVKPARVILLSTKIAIFINVQLMVTLVNGDHGLHVVRLVVEDLN